MFMTRPARILLTIQLNMLRTLQTNLEFLLPLQSARFLTGFKILQSPLQTTKDILPAQPLPARPETRLYSKQHKPSWMETQHRHSIQSVVRPTRPFSMRPINFLWHKKAFRLTRSKQKQISATGKPSDQFSITKLPQKHILTLSFKNPQHFLEATAQQLTIF